MRAVARDNSEITFPDTYIELENTATRIASDFKPEHANLIDGQRKKQKRRERRIKRGIVSLGGWAIIGLMIYLIAVTARTIPKIWDPYEVLGVARVWTKLRCLAFQTVANSDTVRYRQANYFPLPKALENPPS